MVNLENIIQGIKQGSKNWVIDTSAKLKPVIVNYAIDTSAKVMAYAPLMASMEAYNGLDGYQILKSRAAAALVDGVAARVYTKTADYVEQKTKPLTPLVGRNSIKLVNTLRNSFGKKNLTFGQKRKVYRAADGARKYVTDTASMVGVYTPVYAAILKASGADNQQTASALVMGALIAAVTSRPFREYALKPWRNFCGYYK